MATLFQKTRLSRSCSRILVEYVYQGLKLQNIVCNFVEFFFSIFIEKNILISEWPKLQQGGSVSLKMYSLNGRKHSTCKCICGPITEYQGAI